MKKVAILAVALLAVPAMATQVVNYGWEDGGTVLGTYGNVGTATNVSTPVYSGLAALEVTEDPIGSTPQAFVAHIKNLNEGDVVEASFWAYDTTPEGSPSQRIWGHYALNDDIDDYQGSAGGNSTYPAGDGWSLLSHSWTIPADKESLVVELRLYSPGDATAPVAFVIDDLTVTAPDTATVVVPVPEPATLALLAMGGLVALRRRG